MALYEPLFEALNRADVRYVVVGGLAAVLHGHARLTADVDLVVDLAPEEARRAIETLLDLGLEPRLPVEATDFADEAIRRQWVEERGMRVFSLFDPSNPMRSLDLFAEHPIAFEQLWSRAVVFPLRSTHVRVVSVSDLIELKRLAGRPKDLQDIEALEAIRRSNPEDRGGEG